MEKVGDRIDGRLNHGNQAAYEDVSGQKIGNGKRNGEVGYRKGNRLQQGVVAAGSVVVNEHLQRTHDRLCLLSDCVYIQQQVIIIVKLIVQRYPIGLDYLIQARKIAVGYGLYCPSKLQLSIKIG